MLSRADRRARELARPEPIPVPPIYGRAALGDPDPDPVVESRRRRIILRGDVRPGRTAVRLPLPTRCWLREKMGNPEECVTIDPELRVIASGHEVACHFAERVDDSPNSSRQPVVRRPARRRARYRARICGDGRAAVRSDDATGIVGRRRPGAGRARYASVRAPLRIALAQIAPRLGLLDENLARHHEIIDEARSKGAGLVVFPSSG